MYILVITGLTYSVANLLVHPDVTFVSGDYITWSCDSYTCYISVFIEYTGDLIQTDLMTYSPLSQVPSIPPSLCFGKHNIIMHASISFSRCIHHPIQESNVSLLNSCFIVPDFSCPYI